MDGATSPVGNAGQAAPAPGSLTGPPVGFTATADGRSPMGFVPDFMQRPGTRPLPMGNDTYALVSPGFITGTTVSQRPVAPVVGMDFTQMMKLSEGVPSTPMGGMLGCPAMPKTSPKPVQPRHTPDGALSPDSRFIRTDEGQARLPHTPLGSYGPLMASPGGVSVRRGGGSAGSSTVSSSTSGPGARCGATGRSSTSTPASRSNISRKISTPVSRPLPTISGLLGSTAFHTEYREQMSPSWWLGAAACSSSWLQLAPPPEVMELVEKKKLTEQFKTVEGLIDRADYLGALRLQADRRNVLHFLALDEQEMQTYLWQPRFPRIIDLRNRNGNAATHSPPRPTDHVVDPKQLWLRFLTICPPLYSASPPILAGSEKKSRAHEKNRRDSALLATANPPEPQEYCLKSAGEQFLPILFDDADGAAECVPPEELLLFEEDALRVIASHIEAKLTHALTCMLLAARARVTSSASKCKRSRLPGNPSPASGPAGEGDNGVAEALPCSNGSRGGAKRRRSDDDGLVSSDPAQALSGSPVTEMSANVDSSPSGGRLDVLPNVGMATECWGIRLPAATDFGTARGRVVIGLEDLVATYGIAPSLLRHEHCFQQDSESRHHAI